MAMVAVSLLRLRRRRVDSADGFRLPFHPVLPLLFLVGAVVLLVARVLLEPRETLVDLAILVGALALVPLVRLWRRRPGAAVLGGSADA
jgi:amino acid transporter